MQPVRNSGRSTDSPMTVIDVTLCLKFEKFQPIGDGREYFFNQWLVIDVILYVEFGKFQPFGDQPFQQVPTFYVFFTIGVYDLLQL
jgi:hypothetical protein